MNIKKAREMNHLSQEECANQLSISRSSYNKYENGVHNPSVETLINMSGLFGSTTDFLLGISDIQVSADDLYCFMTHASIDDSRALSCPSVNVPCSFSFRLRRARVGAGYSQESISQKLSISVDEYAQYESGEKIPPKPVIDAIVSTLNVSAPWLKNSIDYYDSHTTTHFNPGEYKGFVDSVFDPIDVKDALLSFSQNISDETAHLVNLINNLPENKRSDFIKLIKLLSELDSFDQGTILGEAKEMIRSSKYSSGCSHSKNEVI